MSSDSACQWHNPSTHLNGGLCLGCVCAKLRDAELIPIQCQRVVETLKSNFKATFPSLSSKLHARCFNNVLEGLLSAAGKGPECCLHVYELVVENFDGAEIVKYVLPPLVFYIEADSGPEAQLVLQVCFANPFLHRTARFVV